MGSVYRWIHRVWYEEAGLGWVLLPLSWLYQLLIGFRQRLYHRGVLKRYEAKVPVIVIGNITVGGTGKTPTVIWLVGILKDRGYSPGIVSRGYGGSKSGSSMRVDASSDPAVVGDEPILLARRAECPVVVDADRVRAAAMLVEDGVDVIVTDDGLQHLRLQRDFEICVIDAARGLGNGRLLPAGPLREPVSRLQQVDAIIENGKDFELLPVDVVRLNGSLSRALTQFADTTVHAVAGIGNPRRFFDLLRAHGLQVLEHVHADHAVLTRSDLEFGDDFEVFMTEKDAVKLNRRMADKYWYLPVKLEMEPEVEEVLVKQIEARLAECESR